MSSSLSRAVKLLVLLTAAGVSDEGIAKLLRLRRAYSNQNPAYDGAKIDKKRLEFAKWLYLSGRIKG